MTTDLLPLTAKRKKPTLRGRARNGALRAAANQAVYRFLQSNPAPYGGEFWKVGDVSAHGYYMFIAGYRKCKRDQKAAGKVSAFIDKLRKPRESNADAARMKREGAKRK